MATVQLTTAQRAAVENRGGSLLVSAAAGSGKTKVLVERLFSHMMEEGCNVDDFLIITFTKAAAAELRSKIAQELSRRVAEEPENSHLRRQLFRVYQADIKTVDAFCVSLLRQNVHLLPGDGTYSLTPDFRVLDDADSTLMKSRVLGRVLEAFYVRLEQERGESSLLAETLGAGRDDRALEALVLELHNKIQSHAHPLQWLRQVRESWSAPPKSLAESSYGRIMMADAARKAIFWAERLEASATKMAEYPKLMSAYADRFHVAAAQLRQLAQSASQGWDDMGAVEVEFRRLGAVRGEEGGYVKEEAKRIWDQCKKEVRAFTALFAEPEAGLLEDLEAMAPAMEALLQLTEDFTHAYQQEKLRRNAMDFADQEHYAVELLVAPDGQPTDLARQVSQRYREIMVDEYQDTNEVQNCIFRAISREEKNLFVVGDVKQSIYRFRLADPGIFLRKYRAYTPYAQAEEGAPRKVLLSRNFRSRSAVLDATNFIFTHILSQQMGEMEYGEDERLYCGADYYLPREDGDTEFHFIDLTDSEAEQFDRTEVEARFVAKKIRNLLDSGFLVQEGEAMRPVRPEDIVILMRSPRARQKAFTAALARENVPCTTSENENLFATMEIAVLVSLLQIIDNPRQDVPLISVLRSPLFGFAPDRLAMIRSLQREGDYYEALLKDQAEDSRQFCTVLDSLRQDALEMSVDQLIWQIFTKLHVNAIFGAMEGGQRRKEHLMAFYAYAGQMAAAGKKSLFDFVTHLRRLLENDDQPMLNTQTSASGVQIMSIHKSKGLEFPVVILADLHKLFNADDFRRPVLVHPQLGLGCERVDLERRIRYDTVSKKALALQMRRESMAEEMRILYVAMTRAREKLIMVHCMHSGTKRLRDLATLTDLPVPPEVVESAKCPGDWVLLPLLATHEASVFRHRAGAAPAELGSTEGGWALHLWENPRSDSVAQEPPVEMEQQEVESADFSAMDAVYGHESICLVPSKVTATQLKGRALDEELAADMPPVQVRPGALTQPRFLQETQTLTPAERGTAMHLAMQFLPFDTPATEEAVAQVVKRLERRHLLTPEQAACVEVERLAAFLRSDLARRIRAGRNLRREYPFALLVPASFYDARLENEEEMLLQGVVDCCYETEEGLIIVDFKTDRIRHGEEPQRAESYRPQLEAYAHAVSRVLEQNVCRKILYFFATDTEIAVD